MNRKLPAEAFSFYVGLGAERSYQLVAEHYGVVKQTVVATAARESWQEKLAEMERAQRAAAEQRARETLDEMNERHLRILQVVQKKALEALRTMPLGTAMEAVRALDLAVRQERVIRGEPSDRTAVTVEELIKREHARWMGTGDADGDGDDASGGGGDDRGSGNGNAAPHLHRPPAGDHATTDTPADDPEDDL